MYDAAIGPWGQLICSSSGMVLPLAKPIIATTVIFFIHGIVERNTLCR